MNEYVSKSVHRLILQTLYSYITKVFNLNPKYLSKSTHMINSFLVVGGIKFVCVACCPFKTHLEFNRWYDCSFLFLLLWILMPQGFLQSKRYDKIFYFNVICSFKFSFICLKNVKYNKLSWYWLPLPLPIKLSFSNLELKTKILSFICYSLVSVCVWNIRKQSGGQYFYLMTLNYDYVDKYFFRFLGKPLSKVCVYKYMHVYVYC